MSATARGTFEIQLRPQPPYDTNDGVSLGRVEADKQFRGDLVAQSRLEMLSARTPVEGSAVYAAGRCTF